VLMYRSDLFELYGKQPPRTWEEYQQLADFFQSATQLRKQAATKQSLSSNPGLAEPWSATLEPLADGWASRLLLARAAAYAKHRDYVSVLFDRETMEPLIAGPAFVRALTELTAAAKAEHENAKSLTPEETFGQFLAGHAAMAITWPSAAAETQSTSEKSDSKISIAFAALPGSTTAYNLRRGNWEPRRDDEAISIPVHMISGRVGSVCHGTDSAEAAFHLLVWLSGNKFSSDILPASSATTMFRHSQLDDPRPWVGPAIAPTAANEYGQVLIAALRQPEFITVPRIPGESEYMAALDDAVRASSAGKQSPQKSLEEAVVRWKEITGRFGASQQLEAYRRSIKVAP
jgi:ABC-type glycerol-3-phosphate transport system substrate-binding protein